MSMAKSEPYTILVEDCPHGYEITYLKRTMRAPWIREKTVIRTDCPKCRYSNE